MKFQEEFIPFLRDFDLELVEELLPHIEVFNERDHIVIDFILSHGANVVDLLNSVVNINMFSSDLPPNLFVLLLLLVAHLQELLQQVLPELLKQIFETLGSLGFELAAVQLYKSEVIFILDLDLYFPICRFKLLVLVFISAVGDLCFINHRDQVLIVQQFRVVHREHRIEIVLFISQLLIHLVLQQ